MCGPALGTNYRDFRNQPISRRLFHLLHGVASVSWSMRLIRPVVPPKGRPIVTLSDARDYALALTQAQQNEPHVQAGVTALLKAANGEVDEFIAQAAVAHIVHGPPKIVPLGKRERPWLPRKPRT